MIHALELRRWLGLEPPRGLVGCLQGLASWSGGSQQQLEDGLDEVFGVGFSEGLHEDLPPEVFPFLRGGEHAERFAYVVWAPELPRADHPVVRVDRQGKIRPYAVDTPAAFRRLIEDKLEWDEEFDERVAVELFHAMQLPDVEAPVGELRPEVPVGWHHAPTRDGIGVLAAAAAFDLDLTSDPSLSVAEHEAWVGRLMMAGLPASALVVLKDAWFEARHNPSVRGALGNMLAEAYLALGRTPSAHAARRRTALQS